RAGARSHDIEPAGRGGGHGRNIRDFRLRDPPGRRWNWLSLDDRDDTRAAKQSCGRAEGLWSFLIPPFFPCPFCFHPFLIAPVAATRWKAATPTYPSTSAAIFSICPKFVNSKDVSSNEPGDIGRIAFAAQKPRVPAPCIPPSPRDAGGGW